MNASVNFILDTLFTLFEFAAIYLLSFVLFKLPVRGAVKQLLFGAFLISLVTNIAEATGYQMVSIFLQIGLFFILLRLMFELHSFYALIVTLVGYFTYAIFSIPISILTLFLTDMSIAQINGSYYQYLVQSCSTVLALLSAYWIRRKWLGFDFVPDGADHTIDYSQENKWLWALMFLSLANSLFFFVQVLARGSGILHFGWPVLMTSVAVLLYAFQKDRAHARVHRLRKTVGKRD